MNQEEPKKEEQKSEEKKTEKIGVTFYVDNEGPHIDIIGAPSISEICLLKEICLRYFDGVIERALPSENTIAIANISNFVETFVNFTMKGAITKDEETKAD